MYLRIGRRIIQMEAMTDAEVFEAGEALSPYEASYAEARMVVLHLAALTADHEGLRGPRTIWLYGEDADAFLAALPIYEPTLGE